MTAPRTRRAVSYYGGRLAGARAARPNGRIVTRNTAACANGGAFDCALAGVWYVTNYRVWMADLEDYAVGTAPLTHNYHGSPDMTPQERAGIHLCESNVSAESTL